VSTAQRFADVASAAAAASFVATVQSARWRHSTARRRRHASGLRGLRVSA